MAVPYDEDTVLELEDFGISGPQRCTGGTEKELMALRGQGKPLPEGYYDTSNGFYYMPSDPDALEKVQLALELQQLRHLRTIKRGVLFLVALALLALAVPFLLMILN